MGASKLTSIHESDLIAKLRAEIGDLKQALQSSQTLTQSLQSPDLDELLNGFGKLLFAFPGVEGCVVHLVQESGIALVMKYVSLPTEFADIQNTYHGFQYRVDQGDVNAHVFKSGKSVLLGSSDLSGYAETTRVRFERWKMRSQLIVPLTLQFKNGKATQIGTIAVFSQSDQLDTQLVESIEALGRTYAPQIQIHWNYLQALGRARLVEAMSAEIQQFIAYITEMNSLTAVEQVYASIAKEFMQRFHFDLVNIMLCDGKELAMVHTSFSKPYQHLSATWQPFRTTTKFSLDVKDGQTPLVFSNNMRFVVDDAMKVLHLPMSEKDKKSLALLRTPRSFIIIPIRLNEKPIGVMWLATLSDSRAFSESELTLIELLSGFVGTAIRNAQVHTRVERQNAEIDSLNHDLQSKIALLDQLARKDHLTGLNNFGNFEEELKRRTSEYARAAVESNLSVILIDIDYFKQFNDTHGHPAGNEVLREVGARIVKAVREMDFVARYGGEEFVVLLPQCNLADASAIAERIRRSMSEQPFVVEGKQNSITVSGGYAQFNKTESARDLLSRVDAALYQAKHLGRNRIENAVNEAGDSVR